MFDLWYTTSECVYVWKYFYILNQMFQHLNVKNVKDILNWSAFLRPLSFFNVLVQWMRDYRDASKRRKLDCVLQDLFRLASNETWRSSLVALCEANPVRIMIKIMISGTFISSIAESILKIRTILDLIRFNHVSHFPNMSKCEWQKIHLQSFSTDISSVYLGQLKTMVNII